ncbi:hypothetical protein [Phenylobacterium sp.]|uniref:hypothetical protein n=1 Tax=Phenylobacterium sp. TaxID=1871053 RepID=UPI002E35FD83|nr:hypothetical protein [Phenylobacterium sp.]HEX2560619.1 hypothetical protein [Phenylobacterium sp.]
MTARLSLLLLILLALAGCGPKAPEGVDKAMLDTAVSQAVGDPGTCVLIAEAGGGQVYRFGTHAVCGRKLPDCAAGAVRTAGDLLDAAARADKAETASCASASPGRRVAWAWGPIQGAPYAYAAVMEGPNTPPGIVIDDKLQAAFRKAGVGAPDAPAASPPG